MNLFINAVSTSGVLILFDNDRNLIAKSLIEIKGNESSKLTRIINKFLADNAIEYGQLENIVVVHGPWSFTGVRAICLIVNTIAFSTNTQLTPLSYFSLFKSYPIAKQSSKRDMFFQRHSTEEVQIMSNESVVEYLDQNSITTLYWEAPGLWDGEIIEKIDYSDIISTVVFENYIQIDPLYLKKPNIC